MAGEEKPVFIYVTHVDQSAEDHASWLYFWGQKKRSEGIHLEQSLECMKFVFTFDHENVISLRRYHIFLVRFEAKLFRARLSDPTVIKEQWVTLCLIDYGTRAYPGLLFMLHIK